MSDKLRFHREPDGTVYIAVNDMLDLLDKQASVCRSVEKALEPEGRVLKASDATRALKTELLGYVAKLEWAYQPIPMLATAVRRRFFFF